MIKRKAENKSPVGRSTVAKNKTETKRRKLSKDAGNKNEDQVVTARFLEDDHYVDMDVTGLREDFPSEEEEEGEIDSGSEIESDDNHESQNNNATVEIEQNLSAKGSKDASQLLSRKRPSNTGRAACEDDGSVLHFSNTDPSGNPLCDYAKTKDNDNINSNLEVTFALMQSFMLQKGLLDNKMTEREIKEFLQKETGKKIIDQRDKGDASSEITLYKRAVPINSGREISFNPELDQQIDQLLNQTRLQGENVTLPHHRKISSILVMKISK